MGVFGRNHARVYKELELQGEPVRLLGVVDPDTSRADAVAREFECKAFGSVHQLLTTHSEVPSVTIPVGLELPLFKLKLLAAFWLPVSRLAAPVYLKTLSCLASRIHTSVPLVAMPSS